MGCIIALIISFIIGAILAIFLAPFFLINVSNAKKAARSILENHDSSNIARINRIMGVLSSTKDDWEARDLWEKLQRLKDSIDNFS